MAYTDDINRILEVVTEIRDLLKKETPPKPDVLITCPRCYGDGKDSNSTSAVCEFCNGAGKVIMTR